MLFMNAHIPILLPLILCFYINPLFSFCIYEYVSHVCVHAFTHTCTAMYVCVW